MMTRMSSAVALDNSRDSDAEIIQQVLAGNTALFELLMRRYNERIYRAARSIVRDEQEAEDIMPAGVRERLHAPASVQRVGTVFDMVDEDRDQRGPGSRPPPRQVRGV